MEENSFSPLTGILLSFAPPVGRIYSHLDSRIQGFFYSLQVTMVTYSEQYVTNGDVLRSRVPRV